LVEVRGSGGIPGTPQPFYVFPVEFSLRRKLRSLSGRGVREFVAEAVDAAEQPAHHAHAPIAVRRLRPRRLDVDLARDTHGPSPAAFDAHEVRTFASILRLGAPRAH